MLQHDFKDNNIEYATFFMGDWLHWNCVVWVVTYTDGSKCYELLKRVDGVTISINCSSCKEALQWCYDCLLYTSPSPRD